MYNPDIYFIPYMSYDYGEGIVIEKIRHLAYIVLLASSGAIVNSLHFKAWIYADIDEIER